MGSVAYAVKWSRIHERIYSTWLAFISAEDAALEEKAFVCMR